FRPERFFNHRPKRLDAWFTAVQEVARSRVPAELERQLAFDVRLRSRFVRLGDMRALRALVAAQRDGVAPPAELREGRVVLELPHDGDGSALDVTDDVVLEAGVRTARAGRRGLELRGEARLRGVRIESLPLEVVVGSGRRAIVANSAREDGWCSFAARVAADDTRRVRDVSVRLRL